MSSDLPPEEGIGGFDLRRHAQSAVAAYLERLAFYDAQSAVVRRIVEESLRKKGIRVTSVQARAKDPTSFGKKAASPSDTDPTRPKYERPLDQITDLAGVRVITFFPGTLGDIDDMLREEFAIVEHLDKGAVLIEEDRFGYQSVHYLLKLTQARAELPEYERFANSITEVQVRTVLQHAWAEIEHDIQYKSLSVIPIDIRRRFMALAGMLEVADREFQAIQDADRKLTIQARSNVEEGNLGSVEITPDALKAFLDQRIGADGRISDLSYEWAARRLRRLGFLTLQQVEACVRGYDDDQISRIMSGSRLGQTSRFEYMLLAGMGENYVRRLFAKSDLMSTYYGAKLARLRNEGVEVREYAPTQDEPARPGASEDPVIE